ncbi:MAG: MATE family efflux transporter [Porcipelethomonas sp.]
MIALNSDFSVGKVRRNIIAQSVPLMLAQLIQIMYNLIDRIYIGHLEGTGKLALTGIGLAFPVTTLIAAFTNLFGTGGTPLFSISRGAGKDKKAEKIMGQTAGMLLICSAVIFILCYCFRKPILYLFGAGDESYVFADRYLRIYLLGTVFLMFSTGMNGFINAQGYPGTGMLSIIIGAALNIALDPLFIYVLDMGVEGAAWATVISQAASALWVLHFFLSRKNRYRLRIKNMKPDFRFIRKITGLGMAGFIMQGTNCLVQVVCNMTLRTYGGDLYVGIMTVLNSVREILYLPANSVASGAQPVLGYNYGAGQYKRVKQGIWFAAVIGFVYTAAAWLFVLLSPHLLMSVFTDDAEMIRDGAAAMKLYFFGFFFMAFQFSGQSTFTALGCAKRAIFFSLLRKAIIVVPLTIILPKTGLGADGVFIAEPVSNALGGMASFITMWFTVYRKLPDKDAG